MKKIILFLLALCSYNAFAQIPFQTGNAIQNRKVVLFQAIDNDHQYFGLGLNTNMLRYQVDTPLSFHAFFTGTSATTSTELMRITGTGNVGIGTTAPNAPLQFASNDASRKIVLFETANNNHQYSGFGINTFIMRYQVSQTASSHVFYAGASTTASNELMRITGTGNVGIGTAAPNSQLQLGNTITNRKVVLFEVANNDHQYYGLGINNQIFRYQVDNTISSHAFYAATSTTASTELMRITGTGNVGIGIIAPTEKLHVAGSIRIVDGTQGVGKILTSDANGRATWTTQASGGNTSELQKITEGSNTGWRILGRDAANYGDIGVSAVDFSRSLTASTTRGATGLDAFATGFATTASGDASNATGNGTSASGLVSTAMGISTKATQYASTAMGAGSRATGVVSTAIGNELIAKSATEFVVGSFNDTLTTFNATAYIGDNNRTFTIGTGSSNTARRTSFVVQQNGNVGVGASSPNAQLQLGNTIANRKLVLFEVANNDHQYYGVGINNQTLRYQVDATNSSHAFFAGASATASNELMRIQGNGNVGIGNNNPLAPLHFANTQANRKIVLQQGGANDDHQFYGFGINSETLRYQIAGNSSINGHVFYAANTGSASSNELMRITGTGYVGIGITAPTANLMVGGTPGSGGLVTFNGANYGTHFFIGSAQDTYIRGGKNGSHVYINDAPLIGYVKIGAGIPTEKLDVTGNLKVTGNICYTGTIGACSDLRYKTNFSKIENPLNKVLSLNGLHYDWKVEEFKENNFTKDRQIGFIAQEVEKIFPEMVLTDSKGYKSVDYARLTPALVEAIKELKTLNDELKGKNEKLEANGQKIEARLNKIEALLYK